MHVQVKNYSSRNHDGKMLRKAGNLTIRNPNIQMTKMIVVLARIPILDQIQTIRMIGLVVDLVQAMRNLAMRHLKVINLAISVVVVGVMTSPMLGKKEKLK